MPGLVQEANSRHLTAKGQARQQASVYGVSGRKNGCMMGFPPNTLVYGGSYDNNASYSYSVHVPSTRYILETESIVKHFSLTLDFPEIS
jgi:hypothetical protein